MTNETYDFGIAIPYDSDQDRILSEKKYGVKIQQIIKPCTSEYCKKERASSTRCRLHSQSHRLS